MELPELIAALPHFPFRTRVHTQKGNTMFIKNILLASTAVATLAGPALAGGMAAPAPVEDVVVVEPAPVMGMDWTGGYAGLSLGYADVEDADEADGASYGAFAGYQYDMGSWVVGGEVSYDGYDIEEAGTSVDSEMAAKVRVGYDAGQWLPYATAGVSQLTVTDNGTEFEDDGYVYGIGTDYAWNDSWTVGAEVLKHEYEDFAGSGDDIDMTSVAVRASFNF